MGTDPSRRRRHVGAGRLGGGDPRLRRRLGRAGNRVLHRHGDAHAMYAWRYWPFPTTAWNEAITSDCEIREGAEVAELTAHLDLSPGPKALGPSSDEKSPTPGPSSISLTRTAGGTRSSSTNSTDPDITYLEARHRGHARVEDRIRCAKDTGLRNLPFADFANNACWVELVCMAQDLIAFTQGLDTRWRAGQGRAQTAAIRPLARRRTTRPPPRGRRLFASSANGHGPPHWPMPFPGFDLCR